MEVLQQFGPLILVLLGLGVVAGLVVIGLREDRERDPLQDKLAYYTINEIEVQSLEDIELKVSFRDRVIMPIIKRLGDLVANITPQQRLESIRRLTEQAGVNTEPSTFFIQQIFFMVVLAGAGFLLGFVVLRSDTLQGIAWVAGGAALGYYLPMLQLRSKIRRRQDIIIKALPDALDLLVICVEAGLGFDQAMGKVFEKWDNELALAFGRVLREIQLGKARKVALKDMADRMDVPDVNSFVAAIIQAEQLGVSMSKILRVQADQMRVKRRQRAQEKAQQAPVKMMIPMVLLIFPSMWIVLLGPALLQVMDTFGNL